MVVVEKFWVVLGHCAAINQTLLEEFSFPTFNNSFQTPVEIPGVANIDFLRMATNARRKALGEKDLDPLEFYAFVMPKV